MPYSDTLICGGDGWDPLKAIGHTKKKSYRN